LKKSFKSLSFFIILPIVIMLLMTLSQQQPDSGVRPFSELVKAVKNEQVTSLEIKENTTIAIIDGKEYKVEVNQVILWSTLGDDIINQVENGTIKNLEEPAPEEVSWWVSLLPTILMFLIMGIFIFSFMRSQTGGHGIGNFGKSKAKSSSDSDVTFDQVAGADEEKKHRYLKKT